MKYDDITTIIDKILERVSDHEIFFRTPGKVPEDMIDKTVENLSDWVGWKPIPSIIQDSHIDKVESRLGHKLPKSYREMLKYKHYLRLQTPDRAIALPAFEPDETFEYLFNNYWTGFIPEYLIERGLIYFCDYDDYGFLCFDTQTMIDEEYSVVYVDHESPEETIHHARTFISLLEATLNTKWI